MRRPRSFSGALVVALTLLSTAALALPGGKSAPDALRDQDATPRR